MADNPVPTREECDCPLCLKLLYEPCCTPCGHTFCAACLAESLEFKNACPVCRSSGLLPAKPAILLCRFISSAFPEAYSERTAEMRNVIRSQPPYQNLPIFVLTSVMPGHTIKLHAFEPHVCALFRSALGSTMKFGLFPPVDPTIDGNTHATPAPVGTECEILAHLPIADGRFVITARVIKRVCLTGTPHDSAGYLAGRVIPMHDTDETRFLRLTDVLQHLTNSPQPSTSDNSEDQRMIDPVEVWRRLTQLEQLTTAWLQQARECSSAPDQVQHFLETIGDRPFLPALPATSDNVGNNLDNESNVVDIERITLWTCAVVNSVPRVGSCRSIIGVALQTDDSLERLDLLLNAVQQGLDGMKQGPIRRFGWWVWQNTGGYLRNRFPVLWGGVMSWVVVSVIGAALSYALDL